MKKTWSIHLRTSVDSFDTVLVEAVCCYKVDSSQVTIDDYSLNFNMSEVIRVIEGEVIV